MPPGDCTTWHVGHVAAAAHAWTNQGGMRLIFGCSKCAPSPRVHCPPPSPHVLRPTVAPSTHMLLVQAPWWPRPSS